MTTQSAALATASRNAKNAAIDLAAGTPYIAYKTAVGGTLLVKISLNGTKAILDAVAGISTYSAPTAGGVGAVWAGFQAEVLANGTIGDVSIYDGADVRQEACTFGVSSGEWRVTSLTVVDGEYLQFAAAPTISEPVASL